MNFNSEATKLDMQSVGSVDAEPHGKNPLLQDGAAKLVVHATVSTVLGHNIYRAK